MNLKQEVQLRVYDQEAGGNIVLDASGLRVDFDVKHISEFSRATFTIFNLSDRSISTLASGDKYVTLKVRLHGKGRFRELAKRFHISNVVDELKLPERVTTLYCFDLLRQNVLEKQVTTTVNKPTLRNLVQRTIESTGFVGEATFLSFPFGLLDRPMLKTKRPMNGSAQQCLRTIEREFDFKTYTINGGFTMLHNPSIATVHKTRLDNIEPDIVLHTSEMRSNPKVGMATCKIDSNLNPDIQPGSVLDISRLITVGVEESTLTLSVIDDYLKSFSDYNKYQAFAVSHIGSNYADKWNTTTTAYSPSKGDLMPTVGWARKTY